MNNEMMNWEQVAEGSLKARSALHNLESEYLRKCKEMGEELGFYAKEIISDYLEQNKELLVNPINFGQHGYSMTVDGTIMDCGSQITIGEGTVWFYERNVMMTAIEHRLLDNGSS